jgi:protein-L-isoaspartate O-methyltransferase
MFTATYSPDDNKLRLYSPSRLDPETYSRVKAAGFKYAPKQELFVAPMWTPSREDLLIDLCGEIGDEDTSLVERAEERAERFEEYSDKREADAHSAHKAVSAIADNIPFGQPILVGHHSERHARKDAERIENGMRKAVKMWETSKYWESRAQGALHHAKYKELPAVRARRIKGIEADKRKSEREIKELEGWLTIWNKEGLTHEQAFLIAGSCRLTVLRPEGQPYGWTAYDVLKNDEDRYKDCPSWTVEQVQAVAQRAYPRAIARCNRWIAHYNNRLLYEKAMLAEAGASHLIAPTKRPTQLPLVNYRQETFQIKRMYHRGELETITQVEMTKEEFSSLNNDYKGTRIIDNSHRVRYAIVSASKYPHIKQSGHTGLNHVGVAVFLTDSKVHAKPEAITPKPIEFPKLAAQPTTCKAPERNEFDAMKETLRNGGVKVVSAPQLFPTPPDLAKRLIELADIQPGQRVLEPSAGTGNLVSRVINRFTGADCGKVVAVEINSTLADGLREQRNRTLYANESNFDVRCADFLTCADLGTFHRIVMNPPFADGADIKHIRHAFAMLKPGGRLVAICANGPRQQTLLRSRADKWIDLPAGSFADSGTNVNTAICVFSREDTEF